MWLLQCCCFWETEIVDTSVVFNSVIHIVIMRLVLTVSCTFLGLDTTSTMSSSSGHDLFNPLPSAVSMPTNDQIVELTTKLINANIYPPKSQIKRQKMIYHCKFGEFGVMEGNDCRIYTYFVKLQISLFVKIAI